MRSYQKTLIKRKTCSFTLPSFRDLHVSQQLSNFSQSYYPSFMSCLHKVNFLIWLAALHCIYLHPFSNLQEDTGAQYKSKCFQCYRKSGSKQRDGTNKIFLQVCCCTRNSTPRFNLSPVNCMTMSLMIFVREDIQKAQTEMTKKMQIVGK